MFTLVLRRYRDIKRYVDRATLIDQIQHAKKRPRSEIIAWNNQQRDMHLSDLSPELQEYMEDYIAEFIPRNRIVYHWFDVYDLEEERL